MKLRLALPPKSMWIPVAIICITTLVVLTYVSRNTAMGQQYVSRLTSNMGIS